MLFIKTISFQSNLADKKPVWCKRWCDVDVGISSTEQSQALMRRREDKANMLAKKSMLINLIDIMRLSHFANSDLPKGDPARLWE